MGNFYVSIPRPFEKLVKVLSDQTKLHEPDSKYSPLREYLLNLKAAGETLLELSLDKVQEIIGNELPNSAYEYDAFWRDRTRGVGESIIRAGWQIQTLERDENNKIKGIELQVSAKAPRTLEEIDREAIVNALREVGGDKTKAAEQLSITPRTIRNILKRYELESSGANETNSSGELKEVEEEHIGDASPGSLQEARVEFERNFIRQCLEKHDWDVTKAAEELGIERTHLHRKMEEYGIER